MKLRRSLGTLALVAAVGTWTATASAQQIHSFSDLSDSAQGTQQGTRVQTRTPTPVQGNAAGQESEAARPAGGTEGSYEIGIHGQPRQGGAVQNTAQVQGLEWPDLYRGIIPGRRDVLPHLEQAQAQGKSDSRPNQLTWIGFLPEESRTRVFFQGARAPQYEMQRSQDGRTLTINFRNARLPKRNFSRFIDTSYFERAVTRIETKARGGDVVVTVHLREGAFPTVNREGDYLFFDFPHTPAQSGTVARANE